MRILLLFCNQTMKKVLERAVLKLPFQDGAPIQRAILCGPLEWKGTLRMLPQLGCPRVCPPWAHRSYATEWLQKEIPFHSKKKTKTKTKTKTNKLQANSSTVARRFVLLPQHLSNGMFSHRVRLWNCISVVLFHIVNQLWYR